MGRREMVAGDTSPGWFESSTLLITHSAAHNLGRFKSRDAAEWEKVRLEADETESEFRVVEVEVYK